MANALITSDIILNEALLELKNSMVMGELVDKQYSNQFGNGQTLKRGDSVSVRRRVNFLASNVYANDGDMTGNVSDIVEGSAQIKLDSQQSVVFEVSSQDLTLDISQFSERYIRPAMIEISQRCESDILREFQKSPTIVNSGLNTFADVANIDAIMDDYGVPMDGQRCLAITPQQMVSLAAALTNVFPTEIATRAIERALVATMGNLPLYKTQSAQAHTVGPEASVAIVVDGAQENDYTTVKDNDYLSGTLAVAGLTASITDTLLVGDTFTIAGVQQVNHRTRQPVGRLQSFSVVANATSDAGGLATLTISPALITSGPYQTVYVDGGGTLVPDAAAVTLTAGTAGQVRREGIAFHKMALTLATADLESFKGGVDNSTGSLDGYSMRIAMDSDVLRDKTICRLDMLYGVKLLEIRASVRVTEV